MGRTEDPRVETVFKMADRGMPLQDAWAKNGKQGTWGNVQRRYKARLPPAPATKVPSAASGSSSGKRRRPQSMQAQAVAFKRRNIGSRSSRSDRSGSRLRGGRSGGATPSLDTLADFVGLAPVAAPGWREEALTYGRVCRSCGDVGDALR